jgi:hypothetical protein
MRKEISPSPEGDKPKSDAPTNTGARSHGKVRDFTTCPQTYQYAESPKREVLRLRGGSDDSPDYGDLSNRGWDGDTYNTTWDGNLSNTGWFGDSSSTGGYRGSGWQEDPYRYDPSEDLDKDENPFDRWRREPASTSESYSEVIERLDRWRINMHEEDEKSASDLLNDHWRRKRDEDKEEAINLLNDCWSRTYGKIGSGGRGEYDGGDEGKEEAINLLNDSWRRTYGEIGSGGRGGDDGGEESYDGGSGRSGGSGGGDGGHRGVRDGYENESDEDDKDGDAEGRLTDVSSIASGTAKHLLDRHSFSRVQNQLAYQIKVRSKDDLESDLAKRNFFDRSWADDQCLHAVETAFEQAKASNIVSGKFTHNVFGENITVALRDGILQTSWGSHKYTLADFGF